MARRVQDSGISSTVPDDDPNALRPPVNACSRNVVYREHPVRSVEISYTDIFLDVSEYERDKRLLVENVLGLTDTGRGGAGKRIKVLVVCSDALYAYLKEAELEKGRQVVSEPILRTKNADVYVCDVTLENAPERVDRFVTFNLDPFEICVGGPSLRDTRYSKFKRAFRHAMTADRLRDDPTPVRLVFSVFLLSERSMETFGAANNVYVKLTEVDFFLVDDNRDADTVRDIVCNYCTDLMLYVNVHIQPFVVDGKMPPSVDFALDSNPFHLVKLVTRPEYMKTSPENEYFRFKQFYHTFAYGKQSKWGIEVEGGGDPAAARSQYICSLNDALHTELNRLFKFMCINIRQKEIGRRRAYRSPYLDAPQAMLSYEDGIAMDEEESVLMTEAREKLFKVYYACPILMSSVDVRSITLSGNDEGKTLLKRDQQKLLAKLKIAKTRDEGGDRPAVVVDNNNANSRFSIADQVKLYDTMTYPYGGDVSDTNTLDIVFSDEIGLSGCIVKKNGHADGTSRVKYNGFLCGLLYPTGNR